MHFIELLNRDKIRFLIDFTTGWEIRDKGPEPALWMNDIQGRNLNCSETYEALRKKLLKETP